MARMGALRSLTWCSTHPWLYGDSTRESERAYSVVWRVDMRKRADISTGSGAKVGGRADGERGATWPAGDGCRSGSKMRTCFVASRAMADHLPSPAPNGALPGGFVRCRTGSSAFVVCQVGSNALSAQPIPHGGNGQVGRLRKQSVEQPVEADEAQWLEWVRFAA